MQAIRLKTTDKMTLDAARKAKQDLAAMQLDVVLNPAEFDYELVIKPSLSDTLKIDQQTIIANNEANLFRAIMLAVVKKIGALPTQIDYKVAVTQRVFSIDIGRKFFPLAELLRLVDSLALFGFTHLQLHFSENEGFRIESKRYPNLMSNHYLTQAEIKSLIMHAKARYIEIIPDFDTPGHLKQVLKDYPKWQLEKINEAGQLVRDPAALDILNPEAVAFIKTIYQEFGELFIESRYFHIGADEFVNFDQIEKYPKLATYAKEHYNETASGIEVFIEFVNEMIAYIRQLGFIPRVWNDGFFRLNRNEALSLSSDCEISYWTKWDKNMAPAETFIQKGYQMINHNDNYLYYVLGEHSSYKYPTYESITSGFDLKLFASNQALNDTQAKQMTAVAISVWCDVPDAQTPETVIQSVFWLQVAMMQKVYQITPLPKENYQKLFDLWQSKKD